MRRQVIIAEYPGSQSLSRYDHNQLQALRYDDMQCPTGYLDKGAVTLLHHTYTHERRQANSKWIPRQSNLKVAFECQHYEEKQTSLCRTLQSPLWHVSERTAAEREVATRHSGHLCVLETGAFTCFPFLSSCFPLTSRCAVPTKSANASCTRTHTSTRQSAARKCILFKGLGTKKKTATKCTKEMVFV